MMKAYLHTQISITLLALYSVVILVFGYLYIWSNYQPIFLISLIIMFIVMALFATLTVMVDERRVSIKLGIGLIQKHFTLKDIESYQMVSNPWYYGWGIRYTSRGWLFAVSRFSAIELLMKNGKSYRMGRMILNDWLR